MVHNRRHSFYVIHGLEGPVVESSEQQEILFPDSITKKVHTSIGELIDSVTFVWGTMRVKYRIESYSF